MTMIMAPDGKQTKVNVKRFGSRRTANSFIKLIEHRLHDLHYDKNNNVYTVRYYRDTKRNREMYGFEEDFGGFHIKEEWFR